MVVLGEANTSCWLPMFPSRNNLHLPQVAGPCAGTCLSSSLPPPAKPTTPRPPTPTPPTRHPTLTIRALLSFMLPLSGLIVMFSLGPSAPKAQAPKTRPVRKSVSEPDACPKPAYTQPHDGLAHRHPRPRNTQYTTHTHSPNTTMSSGPLVFQWLESIGTYVLLCVSPLPRPVAPPQLTDSLVHLLPLPSPTTTHNPTTHRQGWPPPFPSSKSWASPRPRSSRPSPSRTTT